jgi:hypothetical protein
MARTLREIVRPKARIRTVVLVRVVYDVQTLRAKGRHFFGVFLDLRFVHSSSLAAIRY